MVSLLRNVLGIEGPRYQDRPEGRAGPCPGDADDICVYRTVCRDRRWHARGQEGTPGQDGMLPQKGSRSREGHAGGYIVRRRYASGIYSCGLVSTPGMPAGLPAGSPRL